MVRKKKTIEKLIEEPEKEPMVSIFDPTVNAFREVPLSVAVKFIEEADRIREELIVKGLIEEE